MYRIQILLLHLLQQGSARPRTKSDESGGPAVPDGRKRPPLCCAPCYVYDLCVYMFQQERALGIPPALMWLYKIARCEAMSPCITHTNTHISFDRHSSPHHGHPTPERVSHPRPPPPRQVGPPTHRYHQRPGHRRQRRQGWRSSAWRGSMVGGAQAGTAGVGVPSGSGIIPPGIPDSLPGGNPASDPWQHRWRKRIRGPFVRLVWHHA